MEIHIPFSTYNSTALNTKEEHLQKLAKMWTLVSFLPNGLFDEIQFICKFVQSKLDGEKDQNGDDGFNTEVKQLREEIAELL